MATKNITLVGRANWCRIFEDNRDMTGYQGAYLSHGGAYTIDLEMDEENEKILKESGSAAGQRKDGSYKFKRKHIDVEWAGGPPKVTKADGTEWSFEDDGVIPNGSTVEVVLSVYDTRMRPGTRIESVRVLEKYEEEDGSYDTSPYEDDEVPF